MSYYNQPEQVTATAYVNKYGAFFQNPYTPQQYAAGYHLPYQTPQQYNNPVTGGYAANQKNGIVILGLSASAIFAWALGLL